MPSYATRRLKIRMGPMGLMRLMRPISPMSPIGPIRSCSPTIEQDLPRRSHFAKPGDNSYKRIIDVWLKQNVSD